MPELVNLLQSESAPEAAVGLAAALWQADRATREAERAEASCVSLCRPPTNVVDCGDRCAAHTYPYIEVKNPTAKVEHEATTSKVSEDQLFYCLQRGISEEDAVSMIVDGFCKQVFKELPMEFAVEAKALLEVSLEGAVG